MNLIEIKNPRIVKTSTGVFCYHTKINTNSVVQMAQNYGFFVIPMGKFISLHLITQKHT